MPYSSLAYIYMGAMYILEAFIWMLICFYYWHICVCAYCKLVVLHQDKTKCKPKYTYICIYLHIQKHLNTNKHGNRCKMMHIYIYV